MPFGGWCQDRIGLRVSFKILYRHGVLFFGGLLLCFYQCSAILTAISRLALRLRCYFLEVVPLLSICFETFGTVTVAQLFPADGQMAVLAAQPVGDLFQ